MSSQVPRWQRVFDRFGSLSPFVTLATFSPAAQRLLTHAERDAERLLHLVRLLVFAVGTAVLLFVFGLVAVAPPALVAIAFAAALAIWVAVWRRLGLRPPGFRLKCALIVFDGLLVARAVTAVQALDGIAGPISGAGLITAADARAIVPPMLVFLALSGAFRLDPRPAMVSTLVSLGVFVYLSIEMPASAPQTVMNGAIIVLAGILGTNAARALRLIALKASEQQVLERYVPEGLTREIARSGDPERAGRVTEVTVLMADIRGFTRLSEQLTPAEAVQLLNDYFAVAVAPLAAEGAVLDKYIGDGLLAFFEGPDQADRALRAGRGMLEAVDAFNASRPDRPPLRIGVAIHAGEALVGTVGSANRREYTIIGDVVNVTARLEECNKRFSSTLVISDEALRPTRDGRSAAGLQGPTEVDLRGRGAAVRVYYLAEA